jgi:hypothetical protein
MQLISPRSSVTLPLPVPGSEIVKVKEFELEVATFSTTDPAL